MAAFGIVIALLVAPALLWFAGFKFLGLFIGVCVAFCFPSFIVMTYQAVKHRQWPVITGGPGISWNGGRKKKF